MVAARNGLLTLFLAFGLLAALVFAARAASETPACPAGSAQQTLEVGIVKAVGCWTETTVNGSPAYVGRWEDQERGIDMNGFVLTGLFGGGLQIVPERREVRSIGWYDGPKSEEVQLHSANWPEAGKLTPIGEAIKLGFVAPQKGELLIEDLHFGGSGFAGGLGGLSPVGTIETPVKIAEGGVGSMDLTVALGGIFALKGRPQSVTIALPTESEAGTKLDGFEFSLSEIDAIKAIRVNELEARYSAANKAIAGAANLAFPFSKAGEKGFGGGFAIEDGTIRELRANAQGLHIPIGAPPGGFVTGIGGGFQVKPGATYDAFDLIVKASLEAVLGPEIPTPWGKVAPIEVSSALGLGRKNQEFFFEIRGGVKVFRLPVGDVNLAIYGNAGVQFGAGLGIGFPSYRNNENDPFYIGARVEGWVSKGKFQFEGTGRVALIGLKLFDGRIMVNNKVAGACWVVLGFPGGAVYPYGGQVKDFGVGCGLDYYKEQFPPAASASAAAAHASARQRRFDLSAAEKVIAVKGAGAAPRFVLRGPRDARLRTPVKTDAVIRRKGIRHAFFVNEETDTTHVIIPRSAGRWTIAPYPGSATITSVRAGREAPKEKVSAEVGGRGATRTLSWDSLDRDHTRLLFLERLPDGREVPIFQTDAASGSRRFEVHTGGSYGGRDLRVVVIHGYASRQAALVDEYRVAPPRRLAGPRRVTAWRDAHDVRVTWSGVQGAAGYLVEVALPSKEGTHANFVRPVPAKRRSLTVPDFPGGPEAVARVYALNRDGRRGDPGRDTFLTGPPEEMSLARATGIAATTAARRGNAVRVRTACPAPGTHCQVVVELRAGGKPLAIARYAQTPDTFHTARLTPRSGSGRTALRQGPLRVRVRAARAGERAARTGAVRRGRPQPASAPPG